MVSTRCKSVLLRTGRHAFVLVDLPEAQSAFGVELVHLESGAEVLFRLFGPQRVLHERLGKKLVVLLFRVEAYRISQALDGVEEMHLVEVVFAVGITLLCVTLHRGFGRFSEANRGSAFGYNSPSEAALRHDRYTSRSGHGVGMSENASIMTGLPAGADIPGIASDFRL